jgi:hypothetical protein
MIQTGPGDAGRDLDRNRGLPALNVAHGGRDGDHSQCAAALFASGRVAPGAQGGRVEDHRSHTVDARCIGGLDLVPVRSRGGDGRATRAGNNVVMLS